MTSAISSHFLQTDWQFIILQIILYAQNVQMFLIPFQLHYSNALLCGLPSALMECLQRVQNAKTQLMTRTCKNEHITLVSNSLQWLLVIFGLQILVHAYRDCCLTSKKIPRPTDMWGTVKKVLERLLQQFGTIIQSTSQSVRQVTNIFISAFLDNNLLFLSNTVDESF